jgi:hypothetical protein
VVDVAGTYVVQLIVNDGVVDGLRDTVMITASAAPTSDSLPVPDPIIPLPDGSIHRDGRS